MLGTSWAKSVLKVVMGWSVFDELSNIFQVKILFVWLASAASIRSSSGLSRICKMCLKSPGTDVSAAGFERCPRTFETHFISRTWHSTATILFVLISSLKRVLSQVLSRPAVLVPEGACTCFPEGKDRTGEERRGGTKMVYSGRRLEGSEFLKNRGRYHKMVLGHHRGIS